MASAPPDGFTLSWEGSSHTFPSHLFSTVSHKCRRLHRRGVTSARARRVLDPSFIAACEMKPFPINLSNALDLHSLADEWEVSGLRAAVSDFARGKGITVLGLRDAITLLIDHAAKDCATRDDVLLVADHLEEALSDARLQRLPPDILFDLVSAADPETYDQASLIEFAMKLMAKKPSSAVPLIFGLNFCLLGGAQRTSIFATKSVPRTIGTGEIAAGLSGARRDARFEQVSEFGRLAVQIGGVRAKLEDEEGLRLERLKKSMNCEIERLRGQIKANAENLALLAEGVRREAAALEEERAGHAAEVEALRNEIEALMAEASELREQLSDQQSIVRNTIDQELDLESQLKESPLFVPSPPLFADIEQDVEECKPAIDAMFHSLAALGRKKTALEIDIRALKSRLFVKMVRDKLSYGEYIRHTDARFGMLADEPSLSDMTADEVAEAERGLIDFEMSLDAICPIRGLQQTPIKGSPSAKVFRSPRQRTPPASPQSARKTLP